MNVITFLILVLGVTIIAFLGAGYFLSAPPYDGNSPNFNGSTFHNLSGVKAKGISEVLKWAMNRKPGLWSARLAAASEKPPRTVTEGLRITFISHSTFLIQTGGLNIITDPVWSERASPFSFIGPRRMVRPGVSLNDLPPIDVVMLTHNHYDHLDLSTLRAISNTKGMRYIVPLGVDKFLSAKGITDLTPLDWWDSAAVGESMRVEAVPAQHFSGRGMFDRDKTLWCGFVITSPVGKVYLVGDTGFDEPTFQEVARRTAPYKVALIPIGAYKPEWFMSPIHVSPHEAARLHQILDPELSIGMHFGTFPLADDGQDDPVEDLQRSKALLKIPDDKFITLAQGAALHVQ